MSCGATSSLRLSQHPVTCLLITVVPVLTFVAYFSGSARDSLTLIWNHTFMNKFFFWNVLSSSFVEVNIIKLGIAIAGFIAIGPAVEEHLGSLYTMVYLAWTGVLSGIITSIGIFLAYVITREEYLLNLEVYGTTGLLGSVLVALAHRDGPTSSHTLGGLFCFSKMNAPLVLVMLSGVVKVFGGLWLNNEINDFPFTVVGTYVGWIYIRFVHGVDTGPAGDVTEEFQLIMFFPKFLHRFLKPLCDFTYGVFLLLGFFGNRASRAPPAVMDTEGGLTPTPVVLPVPEVRDPVAERRRARAMRLLDEKFAKLSAKTAARGEDEQQRGVVFGRVKPSPVRLSGIDLPSTSAVPSCGTDGAAIDGSATTQGGIHGQSLIVCNNNSDGNKQWGSGGVSKDEEDKKR